LISTASTSTSRIFSLRNSTNRRNSGGNTVGHEEQAHLDQSQIGGDLLPVALGDKLRLQGVTEQFQHRAHQLALGLALIGRGGEGGEQHAHLGEDGGGLSRGCLAAERGLCVALNYSMRRSIWAEVGDDPVEDLVVLSPFYDDECVALSQLLKLLRPARVMVLTEPKQASISPATVENHVIFLPL
jgi:hypothetical protein